MISLAKSYPQKINIDLWKNKYLFCEKTKTGLRIKFIKNIKFAKINTAKLILLANVLIIIKKF